MSDNQYQVIIRNCWGHPYASKQFKSINQCITFAKRSTGYDYRIYSGDKLVKCGTC